MRKLIVAALAVCACHVSLSAFAGYDLIWRGSDGGRWNDPNNWEWIDHPGLHQVPTETNDVWFSQSMTKPCTVVVDGVCVARGVNMSESLDKTRTADKTLGDVTLSGTGSLTAQFSFGVRRGRERAARSSSTGRRWRRRAFTCREAVWSYVRAR